MSVKEVTYYQVECDAEGCTYSTVEMGHDYSAWSDRDGALADWDCADGQETPDGKHYCDDHRVPTCADCSRTDGLKQDDDEEWWCTEHFESFPEGPEELPPTGSGQS